MICKSVETKVIMGITLIDFTFVSSTGRVSATTRAMTQDQYSIGKTYSGKLCYDAANNRHFSPKFEVK